MKIDSKLIEDDGIQIQNRSLSDPPLSDIDFKTKMAWVCTALKGLIIYVTFKDVPDDNESTKC